MLQTLAILATRPPWERIFSILCRPEFDSIVVDDRILGPKRLFAVVGTGAAQNSPLEPRSC